MSYRNENTSNSLISAVREGRLESVKELIDSFGLSYSQAWSDGYVLLLDAIENKHTAVTKLLLTNGSKVNSENQTPSNTPLHFAVINGDIDIVEMLLDRGANIHAKNHFGETPLYNAIKNEIMEITELLLNQGANVNDRNIDGITPLHIAAQRGYFQIVEHLLKHGAYVDSAYNSTCREGYTPLCLAVQEGHENVVKLLLEYGANVDAQDKEGRTILHFAVEKGHEKVVELLLEYGTNSTLKNDKTPLHLSAQKGNEVISKMSVLRYCADIDSTDEYGRTALHIASKEGRKQVVLALLEYGSDINIMSKNNYTPLKFAITRISSFYNQLDHYDSDYDDYDHDRGIGACEEIAEILEQHIVKMKTANLYVNEQNLQLISSNYEISDFQNECELEIESMKSEKITNNVTFHDILTSNIRLLVIYARNKNVVQILKLDDYKTKFPIYASMINNHFRKGVVRNELLEQGNTFFHSFFKSFPELPYNCTEQIFGHLSDTDLRMFIDACKPANVSSPNTNIKDVAITANFLTDYLFLLFNK